MISNLRPLPHPFVSYLRHLLSLFFTVFYPVFSVGRLMYSSLWGKRFLADYLKIFDIEDCNMKPYQLNSIRYIGSYESLRSLLWFHEGGPTVFMRVYQDKPLISFLMMSFEILFPVFKRTDVLSPSGVVGHLTNNPQFRLSTLPSG